MNSEDELIARAKQGDRQAFHDLVSLYYPIVERFAYQIGNPATQIEDVTQEVFLRVYRSLHQYSTGKFSTWLYTITLNISRDIFRKNKRNQEKIRKLSRQPLPSSTEIGDRLLKNAEHQQLHEVILRLKEKYRVPLVLFYFHEKTYDEIADILSMPTATVKTRVSRARKKLKIMLEASGGEEHDGT